MKTINSKTLKTLLISASNNLFNHYPEVDALNVFPVPDGDTGINMNLTLTSGANEISTLSDDTDIYTIAKTFAHGLLMGARGNSGVITSQIFRGFANALEGATEIDALLLAQAFKMGSETAYKAVMRPVEGTILTVVREGSAALNKDVKEGMPIERALELLLKHSNVSLNRTPELLPILKEVGVVDSGGTGLVRIIEGMYLASKGEFVNRNSDVSSAAMSAAAASIAEEEFGYCTEFIMSLGPDSVKKIFNQKRFTEWLNSHGNSLVVVKDEDIVKVHVHTLTPGEILNYAQQYGEFLKLKIENMTEQHHNLENGAKVEEHVDLVKEETAVEVEEEPEYIDEHNAIIAVSSGSGISQYFKDIGISLIVSGGQTMNPSSEDFLAAINKLSTDNIFILPNNSNIVMAANQAADLANESGRNVFVIPSKTIPQGIVAALNFDPESDPEENLKNMKYSLKRIKSGEITFSIRDCDINGVHIEKDDFIGIFEKDIVVGCKDKYECLLELLDRMIDAESVLLTLFLGEDVTREELFETKKIIESRYPDLNIDIKDGHQSIYSFLIGIE
jgi:hypothetical protein